MKKDKITTKDTGRCYTFLVRLEHTKIGGKVGIGGDKTLADLHLAIQELFDWDDDHLYSFFMDNKYWGKGETYSTLGNEEDFLPSPPEGKAHEKRLSSLALKAGDKFKYIFDYGDEWRCQIKFVGIREGEDQKYTIIEKHGTPPPQYPDNDE